MKNQALFSSNDKSKKLKYRLLQFLFGALRLKMKTAENPKTRNGLVQTKRMDNKSTDQNRVDIFIKLL